MLLDWASSRKLSAKRTASINGRRALACSYEHMNARSTCSPDLISPDYFLWGFINECVMAVASTTLDDIKERIRRAYTEITPQMLAEVRRPFHL